MSISVEDPALSRRGNGRRWLLTVVMLAVFAGGIELVALVIAPGISAAGGCGGG